ncbi:hypothetical protein GCM10023160_33640 [Brachybacterium paraconglomeratum]|uniref:hypothetical protein n=1 Tax=Brachybacterium paraconglomeratum TaxID=173362 RepID=UPI0031F10548
MSSPTPGYIVCGIGIALIVIGFIWGFVIGYYPSDLPVLLGLLLVGAGMAWGGQRMFQTAKRQNTEREIAQRDAGVH